MDNENDVVDTGDNKTDVVKDDRGSREADVKVGNKTGNDDDPDEKKDDVADGDKASDKTGEDEDRRGKVATRELTLPEPTGDDMSDMDDVSDECNAGIDDE